MSFATRPPIKVFAPAKINLFLHVTAKRDDGYHTLQSLVSFADFGDEVTITPTDDFSFTIHNAPTLGNDDNNLVVRAAKAVANAVQKDLNFAITLTKNIPMGAGLGGGSADAAATIKGLLQYWDVALDDLTLQEILLSLGADVPICYHGTSAYFEGIGEIIRAIENAPTLNAVLVYPNAHCTTVNIFKNYTSKFTPTIDLPKGFKTQADLVEFISAQSNDLTGSAIQTIPAIQDILDVLACQENVILTRMSGSGSCCFGLFNSAQSAKKTEANIQKERPDWWVRPVILN